MCCWELCLALGYVCLQMYCDFAEQNLTVEELTLEVFGENILSVCVSYIREHGDVSN